MDSTSETSGSPKNPFETNHITYSKTAHTKTKSIPVKSPEDAVRKYKYCNKIFRQTALFSIFNNKNWCKIE